jgi:hypothetical protein
MFEKLEDRPRTPTGALRNPWVETAFVAMATALNYTMIEIAQRQAMIQFFAHKHAWLEPAMQPVTDLVKSKILDEAVVGTFDGADPAQATDPFQDLNLAQKLIELGKWGDHGSV